MFATKANELHVNMNYTTCCKTDADTGVTSAGVLTDGL